jgi:predicted lipid-binding transport protein (Tim44 family)
LRKNKYGIYSAGYWKKPGRSLKIPALSTRWYIIKGKLSLFLLIHEGTCMRKIALIGIVMLTAATIGCSKKPQDNASETQMAPAPAAQEAAPAAPATAPAPAQEAAPAAPAQGTDTSAPASAPADNKAMPQSGGKTN